MLLQPMLGLGDMTVNERKTAFDSFFESSIDCRKHLAFFVLAFISFLSTWEGYLTSLRDMKPRRSL
jgi:hypothetical protein